VSHARLVEFFVEQMIVKPRLNGWVVRLKGKHTLADREIQYGLKDGSAEDP
jgi:hypothetical protein